MERVVIEILRTIFEKIDHCWVVRYPAGAKEFFDRWVLTEIDEPFDLEVAPSHCFFRGKKFLVPIEKVAVLRVGFHVRRGLEVHLTCR